MTLLVSALFDREIAVAMDTYAAGGDGSHYTKCWAPESGQFIVAGTGLFDVVGPWLADVEQLPASTTAADIVEMTPAYLAGRHANLIAEHPDAARIHTTGFVYSFDADRRSPVRPDRPAVCLEISADFRQIRSWRRWSPTSLGGVIVGMFRH